MPLRRTVDALAARPLLESHFEHSEHHRCTVGAVGALVPKLHSLALVAATKILIDRHDRPPVGVYLYYTILIQMSRTDTHTIPITIATNIFWMNSHFVVY